MVKLVIKVSLSIVDAVKREKEINGVKVAPMHPGTSDESLEALFFAVIDPSLMVSTINSLNDSGMVITIDVVPVPAKA